MSKLPITGEYPPDWSEIGDRVRAEAGHRCIRCKHPYRTGQHGKGDLSPCDEQCSHRGPLVVGYKDGTTESVLSIYEGKELVKMVAGTGRYVCAPWRILTVHHLDGNKANCAWWNLLALCQRCHLEIQGKVKPDTAYFLEHSAWFKPYAAGFYAKKYLGLDLTRAETEARLEELLCTERLA